VYVPHITDYLLSAENPSPDWRTRHRDTPENTQSGGEVRNDDKIITTNGKTERTKKPEALEK